MRKHGVVFLIFSVFVFILSGCTSYTLTSHQEDLIAEYAANSLVQYDQYYNKRLLNLEDIEVETETEEETTEEHSNNGEDESPAAVTMSQALGMNNFTIDFTSYEISDTYTDAVVAGAGMKIVALKFNVTNISSAEALFNLENTTLKYSYKGTFNQTYTYNAQITLILNALNSYKGTFAVGETKEVVLIYKAPTEQLVDGITSISIAVKTDNASNVIKLK